MSTNTIVPTIAKAYFLADGSVRDSIGENSFHPLSTTNLIEIYLEDGVAENIATINYNTDRRRSWASHWFPLFFRGLVEHTLDGESEPRTFAQYITYMPSIVAVINQNSQVPLGGNITIQQQSGTNLIGSYATVEDLPTSYGEWESLEELSQAGAIAYVYENGANGFYKVELDSSYEWVLQENSIQSEVYTKQYDTWYFTLLAGFGNPVSITELPDEQYRLIWQELNAQSNRITDLENIIGDFDALKGYYLTSELELTGSYTTAGYINAVYDKLATNEDYMLDGFANVVNNSVTITDVPTNVSETVLKLATRTGTNSQEATAIIYGRDQASTDLYYGTHDNTTFNGWNKFTTKEELDNVLNGVTTFTKVAYNTTSPASTLNIGETRWNDTDKCLETRVTADVTVQHDQETLRYTRNNSGAQITNKKIVYVSGAVGQNPTIDLATNADDDIASKTIALVTETIDNNSNGFVCVGGNVRGINTTGSEEGETWADGDLLYLGINGNLTNVMPTQPTNIIVVAQVMYANPTQGKLLVGLRYHDKLKSLSDVLLTDRTVGDIIYWNGTVFVNYNIENIKLVKTGWDKDIFANVDLSFSGLTMTLTVGTDLEYYIQNVKYEISAGTYTVDITDTSGAWYFYFTGDSSTFTASQVAWDIRAGDKAMVSQAYYNSTTNEMVTIDYEFHSWEMMPLDHFHEHVTDQTTVTSGLSVTQTSGAETLDITAGRVMDEDILVSILNGTLGTAKFTQELAPLKAYKYWRIGESEIYKDNYDTSVVYTVGGIPQVNPFDGTNYSLTNMTLNKYGAYWVIITTDVDSPIQLWLGQKEADTLNDAIEENGLASLRTGTIDIDELKVAYRVMVQRTVGGYEITQIDNFLIDPETGLPINEPATSHGSLSGLEDDDHPQYLQKDFNVLSAIVHGDVDGTDLFVIRDLSGTEIKKITALELKTYLAISGEIFNSGLDYASQGLGSYKSAFNTVIAVTGSTGQYKASIKDIEDSLMAIVEMPDTSADDTATTQLSFDNGTTYRELTANGGSIPSADLSEKRIMVYRDGTTLNLYGEVSLKTELTHDSLVDSTYDQISAVKGTQTFVSAEGLTREQLVSNGDFSDGTTDWDKSGTSTYSVTNNEMTWLATAQNQTMRQAIDFVVGQSYFWILNVKASSNEISAGIIRPGLAKEDFVNHSGSGNYELLYGKFTYSSELSGMSIGIWDNRTSGWDNVFINKIMLIPITNTSWASLTASQIASKLPSEYWEGEKSIENLKLETYGKNLFDKSQYTDTDYAYKIKIKSSTDYVWSESVAYKTYGINGNELSSGTALTVTSDSNAYYIAFANTIADVDTFQLEQGTSATDYEERIKGELVLNGTFRSVGTAHDNIILDNNDYMKEQYIGIVSTIDETIYNGLSLRDIFGDSLFGTGKTNLIDNGDFNDGINGWGSNGLVSTITVNDGVLVNTVNQVVDYVGIVKTGFSNYNDNHNYYISYDFKPYRTHDVRVFLSGKGYVLNKLALLNEWNHISDIVNISLAGNSFVLYDNGLSQNDMYLGNETFFDNIMFFDLTATFGAGNEPSKEQFEALLDAFKTITERSVTARYILPESVTSIIDADGNLIQDTTTTIVQSNGNLATNVILEYNLNRTAQTKTNTDNIIKLQREMTDVEDDIADLEANKVDVDGDKVLSDNNYTDAEVTKVGYLTVTEAVDLDKTAEFLDLYSGVADVSTSLTQPAGATLTLDSASYGSQDYIIIVSRKSNRVYIDILKGLEVSAGRYIEMPSSRGDAGQEDLSYFIDFDGLDVYAYQGRRTTEVYSPFSKTRYIESGIDIIKITRVRY